VERVLALEAELAAAQQRVVALDRRARRLAAEVRRLEALRRELRADLLPYQRGGALVRAGRLGGCSSDGIVESLPPG